MARPELRSSTLHEITVTTSPQAEEAVADLLGRALGQRPSVYVPAETGHIAVSVFRAEPLSAADRASLEARLDDLAESGVDAGRLSISCRRIRRRDWAESWKRHFKPIEVGGALLLKPSWSLRRARKGQAVVVLDPGLSFGTGQHPTTQFCLRQIAACQKLGHIRSFLDIGTGSGVLAIAAAKLGYQPVNAFDHDPVAVRVAKANARRNRVHSKVSISCRDLTCLPLRSVERYDLVCANLIDTLLLRERRRILSRLQPGGTLVLAGLLTAQFKAIRECYERAGLMMIACGASREWTSGAFRYRL